MAEVMAIKEVKNIEKIKRYLKKKENKRDYTLFVVGINVGLRASDLLSLKVEDIYTDKGQVKTDVSLIEQKTGKKRKLHLNDSCIDAFSSYYQVADFQNRESYIFQSRKGEESICTRSLNRLVKEWCADCRLKGNYGSHTLRKTFGYQAYMNNANNPRILPMLMKIFNHSSQSVTLRYIGIEQDEIDDIYADLNL